jgi:hypothetical protein
LDGGSNVKCCLAFLTFIPFILDREGGTTALRGSFITFGLASLLNSCFKNGVGSALVSHADVGCSINHLLDSDDASLM